MSEEGRLAVCLKLCGSIGHTLVDSFLSLSASLTQPFPQHLCSQGDIFTRLDKDEIGDNLILVDGSGSLDINIQNWYLSRLMYSGHLLLRSAVFVAMDESPFDELVLFDHLVEFIHGYVIVMDTMLLTLSRLPGGVRDTKAQ